MGFRNAHFQESKWPMDNTCLRRVIKSIKGWDVTGSAGRRRFDEILCAMTHEGLEEISNNHCTSSLTSCRCLLETAARRVPRILPSLVPRVLLWYLTISCVHWLSWQHHVTTRTNSLNPSLSGSLTSYCAFARLVHPLCYMMCVDTFYVFFVVAKVHSCCLLLSCRHVCQRSQSHCLRFLSRMPYCRSLARSRTAHWLGNYQGLVSLIVCS